MSASEIFFSVALIMAVAIAFLIQRRDALKQGQANPVGTRALLDTVNGFGTRIAQIEAHVDDIRRDIDTGPTKADVAALAEQIRGVAGHVESVDEAVVRIEQFLINGGPVATAARRRK